MVLIEDLGTVDLTDDDGAPAFDQPHTHYQADRRAPLCTSMIGGVASEPLLSTDTLQCIQHSDCDSEALSSLPTASGVLNRLYKASSSLCGGSPAASQNLAVLASSPSPGASPQEKPPKWSKISCRRQLWFATRLAKSNGFRMNSPSWILWAGFPCHSSQLHRLATKSTAFSTAGPRMSPHRWMHQGRHSHPSLPVLLSNTICRNAMASCS